MCTLSVYDSQEQYYQVGEFTIDIRDMLGKGQQGTVFRAQHRIHQDLCCKVIQNKLRTNSLEQELKIMKRVQSQQCENLVNVYEIVDQPQQYEEIYIFMEACDMDLEKYLKLQLQNPEYLTIDQMKEIINQVISGYQVLRDLKIIHRDLKPENLLVKMQDGRVIVKIADFGVGKILDQSMAVTKAGTPFYQAPEILLKEQKVYGQNQNPYTDQCDIYSLGIIFYRMVFKLESPISDQIRTIPQLMNLVRGFKENKFKVPDRQDIPKELRDLIEKMLLFDPEQRETWDSLYKNKFLNNQDFVSKQKQNIFETQLPQIPIPNKQKIQLIGKSSIPPQININKQQLPQQPQQPQQIYQPQQQQKPLNFQQQNQKFQANQFINQQGNQINNQQFNNKPIQIQNSINPINIINPSNPSNPIIPGNPPINPINHINPINAINPNNPSNKFNTINSGNPQNLNSNTIINPTNLNNQNNQQLHYYNNTNDSQSNQIKIIGQQTNPVKFIAQNNQQNSNQQNARPNQFQLNTQNSFQQGNNQQQIPQINQQNFQQQQQQSQLSYQAIKQPQVNYFIQNNTSSSQPYYQDQNITSNVKIISQSDLGNQTQFQDYIFGIYTISSKAYDGLQIVQKQIQNKEDLQFLLFLSKLIQYKAAFVLKNYYLSSVEFLFENISIQTTNKRTQENFEQLVQQQSEQLKQIKQLHPDQNDFYSYFENQSLIELINEFRQAFESNIQSFRTLINKQQKPLFFILKLVYNQVEYPYKSYGSTDLKQMSPKIYSEDDIKQYLTLRLSY